MTAASVVAVLPHFLGSPARLQEQLAATLGQQRCPELRVVVVVNDPNNRAFKAVTDIPAVEILEPGLNMGYVGALEWVRRRSSADYLWVLQEDLLPLPDCLERLLAAFDGHRGESPLAIASPVVVEGVCGEGPRPRLFQFHLDTGLRIPLTEQIGSSRFDPLTWDEGRTVSYVPLSGALLDLKALESTDGFDVSLWPLQYVDVDMCIAVQAKGYAIQLVADARIRHDLDTSRHYSPFHDWKLLANTRNKPRLIAKYSPAATDTGARASDLVADIPPDIVYSLAQSMSGFASDYSQWVHANFRKKLTWHGKRVLRRIRRMLK